MTSTIPSPERVAETLDAFPDVRPSGEREWFVASRGFAPGAWWLVSFPVGAAMTCPCPAGARINELDPDARACRHVRRVAEFVSALYRRPSMPCDAGAFVD